MKPKPVPHRRASKARDEKPSKKLKADALAGLQSAISGKDEYASVLRFEDPGVFGHVRGWISTRSIGIDTATQCGGLPRGRMVEIYGAEQTGKTTLTDHVMAQVQSMGGVCAVYDSEERKDKPYAAALGVDVTKLLSIQPEHKTIEAAIETARRALDYWLDNNHTDIPLCLVWDSLAGMPTLEEIENPTTKQPGVAAREVRRAMRQLMTRVARAGALFLITNQQYEKIGGFSPTPGVKKATYGGGGIRYAASVRIELIRTGALMRGDKVACGIEGLCRVFKSSFSPPRDEKFHIEWGRGFCNAATILEKLKDHRYITAGWGHYQFSAQGLPPLHWQHGWDGLGKLLAENPEAYKQLATIYAGLPPGVR